MLCKASEFSSKSRSNTRVVSNGILYRLGQFRSCRIRRAVCKLGRRELGKKVLLKRYPLPYLHRALLFFISEGWKQNPCIVSPVD